MKKQILTVLLVCLSASIFSQVNVNMGVIEVSKNYSATLNFPDSVVFFVAANNPPFENGKFKYYDIFKYEKICLIRGNDPDAPETSINIKTEKGLYYGILKYGESKKLFYNFDNDSAKQVKQKELNTVVSVKSNETLLKERLNSVLSDPIEYKSLGTIENGMTFQVANIKNDENYTYYKLIVKNSSGSDYNIDGVSFKFVEGKRKGVNKNEAKIEQRIKIEFDSPVKVVKAYKTEELGFVTTRFSGSKSGSLIIQLREANGIRNPIITISGNKMLTVKVFGNKF